MTNQVFAAAIRSTLAAVRRWREQPHPHRSTWTATLADVRRAETHRLHQL